MTTRMKRRLKIPQHNCLYNIREFHSILCKSLDVYHGLQRTLLTGLFSLVMLVWTVELRWEKSASLRFLSEEDCSLLKCFSFLPGCWFCCCSCVRTQTVISRMSAFSSLESGCCLRNSGLRRDLSCSMLLLIRSLRNFSTRGFLSCRKKNKVINKLILEYSVSIKKATYHEKIK